MHPEAAAVVPWFVGCVVEVGAGGHPTPGVTLTIDHTPAGRLGTAGSETNCVSTAAICADMAALPIATGSFDTLVARHTLEHHHDTFAVLREWARVAHRLVVVCPDQASYPGSTIALDPTHQVAFTPTQLAALAEHAGWSVLGVQYPVPHWSFLLVAEQPGPQHESVYTADSSGCEAPTAGSTPGVTDRGAVTE